MTIKEMKEQRKLEKRKKEEERVKQLYQFEDRAREAGYKLIAGVDEAGRGCLAGIMIVAAVILPPNIFIDHLNDSKMLTHKRREKVYEEIVNKAVSIATSQVEIEEIDEINIYNAAKNGMYRAVKALPIQPDFVLTDAMKVDFDGIETLSIVRGDRLSASIAAASIVAKVTRDRMTDEWDKELPQYGFSHNRGYGTKYHIEALEKYGPSYMHRRSFEPVKSMLEEIKSEN